VGYKSAPEAPRGERKRYHKTDTDSQLKKRGREKKKSSEGKRAGKGAGSTSNKVQKGKARSLISYQNKSLYCKQ